MRTVFDLEANGLDDADTIWCLCTEDLYSSETSAWDIEEESQTLEEACKDNLLSSEEIIGHNIISYDLPLIKKLTGLEPNENTKVTDTLVMSRLANPDRKRPIGYEGRTGAHSLGAWGYTVSRAKPHHEEWSVYSPAMLRRCEEDVGITALVYHEIKKELEGFSEESIELEHQIAKIMSDQEKRGIFFNLEKANEYIKFLTDKIQEIDDTLVPNLPYELKVSNTVNTPFLKTGGYRKTVKAYIDNEEFNPTEIVGPFTRIEIVPFDLGSTEKVKKYLLANGWIPEKYNYSKTTGEQASPKLEGDFIGVEGDMPRLVKERITWRHRRSQIEGWVKNIRPDGSIPAGANSCGTPTNRMKHRTIVNIPKANSTKQGELIWDTNLQKDIFGTQMRSLFIPRPGFKIVGHDASGLELRMLAHYLDDEDFIKEILNGDIHTFNMLAAGLDTRDQAKTFIYALIYGAGDAKIGSIVGGDSADGAELKAKYFDSLPKLGKFVNEVKRSSGKGWLKGLDGRRILMRRDKAGRIERKKAPNTLLQSAGAIVMKRSCVILWDDVKEAQIEAYKVLDMHDEGQSEVLNSPKHIEPYCNIAVNSIIKAGEYYNLNIPLDAEAKVGDNLAETH